MNTFCGLDFGTSNSTFGTINQQNKAILIPLEDGKVTIPSAIFFHFEENRTFLGRAAIDEYIDGEFGRIMRSLKSVLGTPLMDEKTQIKSQLVPFADILTSFLSHLKATAEQNANQAFEQVVLGRPVHFVDGDKEADLLAQDTLESAAIRAGFSEVQFQYEPIAAALDYEQSVDKEEIALIVDIGGGTSDFSVVRISPERSERSDRKDDILANGGIHIGGTDFDRKLSLETVMPHLGYKSKFKPRAQTANFEKSFSIRKSVSTDSFTESTEMLMPSSYYHDLATWHKIHHLYEKSTIGSLNDLAFRVENKNLIERLLKLINRREGHLLALDVEQAKIDLTNMQKTAIDLDYIEKDLSIDLTINQLHDAVDNEVDKIQKQAIDTIEEAGLKRADITKVFMTGGTTAIPMVRQSIETLFPHTEIINGDKFGSVGMGLAIDAMRKYG
ncbi:MAG: Hsp70 family protein [Thalassotalea sp.]|nr:Hsp70 family protein [Thalassotalea sp.]